MFWKRKIIVAISIVLTGVFVGSLTIDWKVGLASARDKESKKFIESARPVPGSYIVVLEDARLDEASLTPSSATDVLTAQFGGTVGRTYGTVIKGFAVKLDPENAKLLSSDPLVRFVEEDTKIELAQTQSNPSWGLDRSDQRTLPLDQHYSFASTADTVDAYVLDTGIRMTHTEFGGRAFPAFDAIGDGNGNGDCHGHGTHVAGIIGGATFGIAKNVRLYSARIINCSGSGQISDMIAAIDWITEHRTRPSVANISSIAPGVSPSLEMAIETSVAWGVVFTLAAGNSAWNACDFTPARTSGAITVAATTSVDGRALWSNYGPCVDIFAPGDDITSAGIADDTSTRVLSGTSMAAPHVAGSIALYLESHRDDSAALVTAAVVNSATSGLVTQPGATSNLLLFTGINPVPCAGPLYAGTLSMENVVGYFPNENGTRAKPGRFDARIGDPGGGSYSFALQQRNSSQWLTVASAVSGETISMDNRQGTYRWKVESTSGGGNFALCTW
jgi:subtilisin family serine protease